MNSLTMTIAGLDKEILLALNSFGGGNKDLWELANNSLFRGFPIFFSLPALWFSGGYQERRGRMLAGLLAVCLATIFSFWSQFHIAVHTRPALDPALHLQTFILPMTWDRMSSFPSDTGTLFFGLAAVVFVERRLLGSFCFVWVERWERSNIVQAMLPQFLAAATGRAACGEESDNFVDEGQA